MDYKYSVIIPVYNAAITLRRCLESLICQTGNRAELILINDGSTDESLIICREYEKIHPEIKVIDQQNAGASAARNAGLEIAKGTYITFVDSDDLVANNYFDILDQTENVDFAIYSYTRIIGEKQIPIDLPQSILTANSHYDRVIEIVRNRFASPWNKRFRREIIQTANIRFKNDLIIGEDFLFGLTYLLRCRTSVACNRSIYFVDESLNASITRSSKHPSSQYSKIYEYAFPLVKHCSWEGVFLRRLLQHIDYLLCRTVFVAAVHLQKQKRKDCTLTELIHTFHNQYQRDIQPLSIKHAIMKLCIEIEAVPIIWAISNIYIIFKRTKHWLSRAFK